MTGMPDVLDIDPRDWATITVPGFNHERPHAWAAYKEFQNRATGLGVKVPSYDP